METTSVHPWQPQGTGDLSSTPGEEWQPWCHAETVVHPSPSAAPSAQGGSGDVSVFPFITVQRKP